MVDVPAQRLAPSLLIAAFLVLTPGASALFQAVDHANIRPLWTAQWTDSDGTTHQAVNGSSVLALTVEGFDATHPDLSQCADLEQHRGVQDDTVVKINVPNPKNEDPYGHGNHVAGILCGDGEMSDGQVRGVAWGATAFSWGLGKCGLLGYHYCPDDWWTEHDLDVITSSTTADPVETAKRLGMPDGYDVLFLQAIGNQGNSTPEHGSPCCTDPRLYDHPRMLSVAAANGSDQLAGYSSRGVPDDPSTWPDLTAPGCMWSITPPTGALWAYGLIVTELDQHYPGGVPGCPDPPPDTEVARLQALGYSRQMGTSMATPFAAGVAVLMHDVNPELNWSQARYLITRTADPFLPTNDTDGDGEIQPEEFHAQHGWKAGWGYVNATAAAAASNYLTLHPQASVEEAVACASTTMTGDGQLVLNPTGARCDWPPEPPQEPDVNQVDETEPSDQGQTGDQGPEAEEPDRGSQEDPAGGGEESNVLPFTGQGLSGVLVPVLLLALTAIVGYARDR